MIKYKPRNLLIILLKKYNLYIINNLPKSPITPLYWPNITLNSSTLPYSNDVLKQINTDKYYSPNYSQKYYQLYSDHLLNKTLIFHFLLD